MTESLSDTTSTKFHLNWNWSHWFLPEEQPDWRRHHCLVDSLVLQGLHIQRAVRLIISIYSVLLVKMGVKHFIWLFTFTRRFYPNSGYTFFASMCVPWELNPQPFALLTQCSTTEPQEHYVLQNKNIFKQIIFFFLTFVFLTNTNMKNKCCFWMLSI